MNVHLQVIYHCDTVLWLFVGRILLLKIVSSINFETIGRREHGNLFKRQLIDLGLIASFLASYFESWEVDAVCDTVVGHLSPHFKQDFAPGEEICSLNLCAAFKKRINYCQSW